MNCLQLQADALHNVDAVAEGKGDTLLCGAEQMLLPVPVEIYSVNAAPRIPIAKNSFCAISEREYANSFRPDGNRRGKGVYGFIVESFWSQIAARPGVQYSRPIEAEQDSQAGPFCCWTEGRTAPGR